ncbi:MULTISPECIES: RAMP superfamily CRISPR-associated protein [Listeria]|uniref:RAMP superfamily CRISPR-associated protein n=1 Tax=Listeria TaxID=1637 RepID=UPI000B592E8B|nr:MULTISPECIES: RAMP superfamily CRISPR-associated protein [Listeria]
MGQSSLNYSIKTESNLLIGGTPRSFEIGGIDQYTVTNFEGEPIIPASTIKGCFRAIVKEENMENVIITNAYRRFFESQKEEFNEYVKSNGFDDKEQKRLLQRFDDATEEKLPLHCFGSEGFNAMPKLIFRDCHIVEKRENKDYFSIDSKNTIDTKDDKIHAIPRKYQTVRPNIEFRGTIDFYQVEKLGIEDKVWQEYIESLFLKLNSGIYRIGNSKSRGYGKVHLQVIK